MADRKRARPKDRGDDRVAALIAQFGRPDPAADPALPDKRSVVAALAEHHDGRVLPFLLERLADEGEDDLARIEILKFLPLVAERDRATPVQRRAVGRLLCYLLRGDPDEYVRNYAADAIYAFFDVKGTYEAVEAAILDPEEDENVRHSALGALEEGGPSRRATRILKKLARDDEWGEFAEGILQQWEAE